MLAFFGAILVAAATATLPADNGGTATFGAGDYFAGGQVTCTNFTQPGSNYSLALQAEVSGAALIIFALQPDDLFTRYMARANASIDAFLRSDAVGEAAVGSTSYLFLAYGKGDDEAAADTSALHSRLAARLAALELPQTTLARMHFACERADAVPGLNAVLAQWTTPINSLSVPGLNFSRLDGKYGACRWPSENQELTSLADGGSGCAPVDKEKFAGKTVVVTAEGCTPEEAANNGGNIIVAGPGTEPVEMQNCGDGDGLATMVTQDAGQQLRALLAGAGSRASVNASLFSARRPGAFAAIDEAGRLQELGWAKYATLEMLAWSAQYFDYLTNLEQNMSQPHFSVPITGWSHNVANVTLPPPSVLQSFSSLEVENSLSCGDQEGRMDQSCPVWDHNVALGVVCAATHEEAATTLRRNQLWLEQGVTGQVGEPGGFPGELARYVTPFRRRLGKWLTPATHMMPLFTQPGRQSCSFSLANPGWVNSFKLRFSGDAAAVAPPNFVLNLFQGGGFDKDYNSNRTLLISEPVIAGARRVELTFVISGHGQMEFDVSTHTFEINGVAFSVSSEGVAGTEMGCTRGLRQGRAQPNEHGTWYTGRNFWCNGADVPVHRFDVTAAVKRVSPETPVNVTYFARGPGGRLPGAQGSGNIVMSSVLTAF